jgi:hypothetical protein
MKSLSLLALVLLFSCFNSADVLLAQGTQIITLSNVTSTCLDTSKKYVDFMLLSARVPRDSNFFQTTRGLGAKVTVTLSDGTNKAPFPVSQAITLTDQDKKDPTVRAYLGIPVLVRYDLWNTQDSTHPIKTTTLSLPVSYIRTVGDSAAVQVMNALISFSGSTNSALPANPYSQDAQMVGQLVGSLGNIFKNSKDVSDPNYALTFTTSQQSTGCSDQSLKEGVGVEIADYDKGGVQQGVIRIGDVDNYCFYKNGSQDPNILFTNKTGASCPSQMPSSYTKLMNPHFVWAVTGTCKTDNGCNQQPTNAEEVSKVAATIKNLVSIQSLFVNRVGTISSQKLADVLANPSAEGAHSLNSKEADTIHLLSTCNSVGVSPEKCLSGKP